MKRLLFVLLISIFLLPCQVLARENVNYWYIKDFKTEIVVNNDSSIDVTENIIADCGSAQKHGIFRVLPTFQQLTDKEKVDSSVKLESITNFDGKPYKYSTTKNRSDGTITWKIGDADAYVTGVNNYRIKYHVKNAVRHNSENFDEFYWNLSGNFWDIDIDNFSAKIIFPDGVNKENSGSYFYSGQFGESNDLEISGNWTANNILEINYDKTMTSGEGITTSITFPKNIISPYVPTFWEKYGWYFTLFIPFVIFYLMFLLWKKVGDDPSINPTVAPEFEIPEKLNPIDMGLVWTDSVLKNNFISAAIINLAVKGVLKIEKIGKKDFKLEMIGEDGKMSPSENKLLKGLFQSKNIVQVSDLKNKFYTYLPKISDAGNNFLVEKKWLVKGSRFWQYAFIFISMVIFGLGMFAGTFNSIFGFSVIASAIIIFVYSFILPVRSLDGALLLRRIKGLRLYLHTAERYRAKFNEKENIFEKFLPYAIMFGMTKEWISKIEEIYGKEYFNSYHPVWFYGVGIADFNIDSLTSEISSMSNGMASTMSSSPSSSGSGGGGFSGGGGGGGGGGGW